jgi:hypothetical protein
MSNWSPIPAPSAMISGRMFSLEQDPVEARLLDVQQLAATAAGRLERRSRPCLAEPPAESPSTM